MAKGKAKKDKEGEIVEWVITLLYFDAYSNRLLAVPAQDRVGVFFLPRLSG